MRIDLVTTELRPGGAERCVTEVAVACVARGWKPRVLSLGALPTEPLDELVARLRLAHVPVVGLGGAGWYDAPRIVRALRRHFREDRPDVVQTFLWHANVLGSVAAGQAGVGRWIAAVRVAEKKWLRNRLEAAALRRAERIACVSQSVAEFVRCQLATPAAQQRIVVTPNGVRIDKFAQAEPLRWEEVGLPGEGRVVLFVGRLHLQKGVDWLLRSLPSLLGDNRELSVAIVGDGPLRGAAEELAAQHPGRVAVLGWRGDVPRLMAAASLLVLPSRFEGMPNVVLEAMASGLPVVATQAEGVVELLGPLADEQTVTFGDDAQLRRAVHRLITDSRTTSQIAAANRLRAQQLFSVEAMTDRFLELYRAPGSGD